MEHAKSCVQRFIHCAKHTGPQGTQLTNPVRLCVCVYLCVWEFSDVGREGGFTLGGPQAQPFLFFLIFYGRCKMSRHPRSSFTTCVVAGRGGSARATMMFSEYVMAHYSRRRPPAYIGGRGGQLFCSSLVFE